MIKSINQINKNTSEGKFLFAALVKLSELHSKTIAEILQELNELVGKLEKRKL